MQEHADGGSVAEYRVAVAVDVLVQDADDAEALEKELDQGMGAEPVNLEDLLPAPVAASCDGGARSSLGCHGWRVLPPSRPLCKQKIDSRPRPSP